MSVNISRTEWLAALGDAVKQPDQDALTVLELAAMFGLSRGAAYRHAVRLVQEKKAVVTVKMITASGVTRRVAAYKLATSPQARKAKP